MAERKFNVGDKVTVNKRCPYELLSQLRRNRARTIKGRFYDPEKQATYYHLGFNYRGESATLESYRFRSYMLTPVVKGRKAGRPKEKREYTKRG